MDSKNKILPTIFSADLWQLHFEQTQEPALIQLSDLSRDYVQLKHEYETAPPQLKKGIYARLKRLESLITAMDESYKQGRDYVGSLVVSLYVEFERMRAQKDTAINELHQSYEVMADTAISLCERNISSQLKRA